MMKVVLSKNYFLREESKSSLSFGAHRLVASGVTNTFSSLPHINFKLQDFIQ
jgi:hypothetical protein